uniref:Uncharacterized protein n=1 Tax=Tanacetum cinerariifolium TaxID=118510 RepID=A0A6L2LU26_TANCI|nr:hypothetical protein [Tanacetum cinerariifolium]
MEKLRKYAALSLKITDPTSSLERICLRENIYGSPSENIEGPEDWNALEYIDTAGTYDGEINLALDENLILNEYAVKLCFDYEVKKGKKVVKKELIVALMGELYFVKFIFNPKEDDVELGVIFGRSFMRLVNGIVDFGSGVITIYPEQDLFEEDNEKKEKNGMIVKEEKEAINKVKGEALKEKDGPRAFIFPIRLEGKVLHQGYLLGGSYHGHESIFLLNCYGVRWQVEVKQTYVNAMSVVRHVWSEFTLPLVFVPKVYSTSQSDTVDLFIKDGECEMFIGRIRISKGFVNKHKLRGYASAVDVCCFHASAWIRDSGATWFSVYDLRLPDHVLNHVVPCSCQTTKVGLSSFVLLALRLDVFICTIQLKRKHGDIASYVNKHDAELSSVSLFVKLLCFEPTSPLNDPILVVAKDLWERIQLLMQVTYPLTPHPNAYSSIVQQDACPQPQSIPQIEYTVSTVNQQTHLAEFPQIESGLACQSQRGKGMLHGDEVLLVEAQGSGKDLNEEELDFLAYPGVVEGKAVLMANLFSYGSYVLSKITPDALTEGK